MTRIGHVRVDIWVTVLPSRTAHLDPPPPIRSKSDRGYGDLMDSAVGCATGREPLVGRIDPRRFDSVFLAEFSLDSVFII